MISDETEVLIIGGGPAGSLLACMLARRGIDVVLVEKQTTLERSFRGETLVASSVSALRDLGFGPAIDAHGYLETEGMSMNLEGRDVFRLNYRRATGGAANLDMPQPALLRIVNEAAAAEPSFQYVAGTSMTDLVEEDGAVVGAVLRRRDGSRFTVRARLVVGADGRFSRVRRAAGLPAKVTPMDRDVLWFRLPRPAGWGNWAEFYIDHSRHLVSLPTWPDHLRIAMSLPKRSFGTTREAGFDAFKANVAALDGRLAALVDEHLTSWEDTVFLEIFTAELTRWARDGLVLIGDASHTCTPILGQGVNLSIQDCLRITPLIARELRRQPPGRPLPATVFDGFVAERRRHKARVTRFQTAQEDTLATGGRWAVAARRLRFRAVNALPVKYWVLRRALGFVPVDPVDRRPHPVAVAAG